MKVTRKTLLAAAAAAAFTMGVAAPVFAANQSAVQKLPAAAAEQTRHWFV